MGGMMHKHMPHSKSESFMEQPGMGGGMGMEQSVGSGFVVRDDDTDGPLIVTNAHVVSDAPALAIQVPAAGQEQYEARVVLVNHDMDIALVKMVQSEEITKMRENLGEHKLQPVDLFTGSTKVGMSAVAMGFPLGMTSVKMSTGVLSGHETVGDFIVYQHTSPISPGNSGGPLFVEGTNKVLGINFATAAGSSSQQNNFAIPSWRVQQMLTAYDKQEEEVQAEAETEAEAEGEQGEVTEGEGESEEKETWHRSEANEEHERQRKKKGKKTAPPSDTEEEKKKQEEKGKGKLEISDDLLAGLFQGMGMSLSQKKISPEEEQLEEPDQDFSKYGVYSKSACLKDRGACEYKVPKLAAEMTIGTEHLYKLYGCESGILVSRVENTSYLAQAEPPVEGKAFITKINGVKLDRFGMGRNKEFFDDPIGFADLLFSRKDLSEPATVETCSCGETKEHTVSLKWKPEMEPPVPHLDEPAFAHLDYEQFGEVTVTPMTSNVAAQLMQMGRIDLLAYVVDPNPEAALIITDVDMGGSSDVMPGSIIAKMNGHEVKTLAELRKHFTDVHDVNVSCGMETEAEGESEGGFGADPLAAILGKTKMHAKPMAHKIKKGEKMMAWTLTTVDGEDLSQPYARTLEQQRSMVSEGVRPLTPGVRAAIKAKIASETKEEEKAESAETEGEGEKEESSSGGLDLLGLFNILGGGETNETKKGDGEATEGETESEGETEGETPPTHKKKAKGKKSKAPEDATEEGAEAVKGAEEGEETADEAGALDEAARLVARKLALQELLAKIPPVPVEQRKFVRRGGAFSAIF